MKNENSCDSIVKAVRAVVDRFDYDFGNEVDFICETIMAAYPGKIPHHACRIVQELNESLFAELEEEGRVSGYEESPTGTNAPHVQ